MNSFKKVIKFLAIIISSIIIVAGVTYAGSLTPPAGTPTTNFYTLSDIYNKIVSSTSAGNHEISTTTTPAGSFRTLYEVYNAIPASVYTAVPLKTNQTICYGMAVDEGMGPISPTVSCAGTGQDGEYQAGVARSYTKSVISGGTVVMDNATGLMWVSDPSTIGGVWGTEGNPLTMSYDSAITNCNNLVYASYSDWRLPNINELITIIDRSKYAPPIDLVNFPNTKIWSYWTSTIHSYDPLGAFSISFYTGFQNVEARTGNINAARCVRGGI